uniref:Uncharacterized protein n=1 Tax=Rhizophora mucronata TaxID=61149 RepID=A0A2P2JNS7_RHIMU
MVSNGFVQELIFTAPKIVSLYSKFNDFSSAVKSFQYIERRTA